MSVFKIYLLYLILFTGMIFLSFFLRKLITRKDVHIDGERKANRSGNNAQIEGALKPKYHRLMPIFLNLMGVFLSILVFILFMENNYFMVAFASCSVFILVGLGLITIVFDPGFKEWFR